jgi:hypothetical protein
LYFGVWQNWKSLPLSSMLTPIGFMTSAENFLIYKEGCSLVTFPQLRSLDIRSSRLNCHLARFRR